MWNEDESIRIEEKELKLNRERGQLPECTSQESVILSEL